MKKVLSVFLAVMLILNPLSILTGINLTESLILGIEAEASDYSGSCGDNLTWFYSPYTEELNISGSGDMYDYSSGDTPWFSFQFGGFSITKIIIEKGVTSIGDNAFYNARTLESIVIPGGITTIGDSAFSNCLVLKNVIFPDTVTSIGRAAFWACSSLESVTIGEGVKTIGDYAFSCCNVLKNLNVPDSIAYIGVCAFSDCTKLEKITVGKNNLYYSSDEYGALYNKDKTKLIQYPSGNTSKDFIIPDSVTTIGLRAFWYCKNLDSVIIPDSVEVIEQEAFFAAEKLTSIIIPEKVSDIGELALYACTGLEKIIVNENNKFYSSDENGVLYNKEKSELIQYPIGNTRKTIVVPDTVNKIEQRAFSECLNLTFVAISEGVREIGKEAFTACKNLETVIIPYSVHTIGSSAFSFCSNLTTVTIPNKITTIDNATFSQCKKLETIIIPKKVRNINHDAFLDCQNLTDIYYSGSETEWNEVSIDLNNEPLTDGTIHYGYDYIHAILFSYDGKTAKEKIIKNDASEIHFEDIADGEYIAIISKEGYVSKKYTVTAKNEDVSLAFELNRIGDLNGDGKINTVDVARANAHAKSMSTLTGYEFDCVDINGDGKVNTLDVAKMNAHAKGITTLW